MYAQLYHTQYSSMSTEPKLPDSDVFNPSLFDFKTDTLTISTADLRYLRIGTSIPLCPSVDSAAYYLNGSLIDISAITGITNGTAAASKALILDSNKDIAGIRNLGTTNLSLNGTINLNGNHNTTWNDNLIVTGSASPPTQTNGIGIAFTGITSTGRIKAYNYTMGSFNNIDINEGSIYCKADKTVSIGKQTNNGYALDVYGDISLSGSLRNNATVFMDNTGLIQVSNQSAIISTARSVADGPCGFDDITKSTISYDQSTRIFTIAPVSGSYYVWVNGQRFTKSVSISTTAHATTAGITYYIYFDAAGTLTISSSTPDMLIVAMVAIVYYYDSTHTILLEERHGTVMSPATHQHLHNTVGTYFVSGLALSGYTIGGTLDTDNTFASSAGVISDEDLRSNIDAVSDSGSPYTVMYMTGSNALWTFSAANAVPFLFTTSGYIQYNQFTGGSWQMTQGGNNKYYTTYVMYLPSKSATTQMVIIMGQSEYSTLTAAQAESFYNLTISSLLLPEYLPLYQLVWKTNVISSQSGKCNLQSVTKLAGTRTTITGAAVINHQSLSGLQLAAAGVTYGHIDTGSQTIYGAKVFSDALKTASYLQVKDSTDTTRLISALNSSLTNGTSTAITFGKANSTNNQAELVYKHASDGSSTNALALGLYGVEVMTIRANNTVSIMDIGAQAFNILKSGSSPAIRLGRAESTNNCATIQWGHVSDGSGENGLSIDLYGTSAQFTCASNGCSIGGARQTRARLEIYGNNNFNYTSGKLYDVSNDSYTSVSSSSINLGIYCQYSIWCNSTLMTSSDRRLKRDIRDFDVSDEAFMKLRPVRYLKNDENIPEVGLIAQEVASTGLIDIIRPVPDKTMKKNHRLDPEDGWALTLQYDRIPMVNMCVIQRLVKTVRELGIKIEELKRNHRP